MDVMQGLNIDQAAAVAHRGGPAIVVAGPGAGKTRVLTARTGSLLQQGVQPEGILLLTFTRSASSTMIRKSRGVDSRAEFITAGTFHSWGIKVINANAHIFGLDRPFTVLDKDDVAELIKKAIEPLKGENNWPRASTVHKIISFAANTQMSIADAVAAKTPDHIGIAEDIEKVRDAYMDMKLAKGLIDYDDVLSYMAILLGDEEIGAQIRSAYTHVMVDEYQDTNALQLAIVHGLVGDDGDVMIVGDPGQSIYAFRGGAPATMKNFQESFPRSKVFTLNTNYRSSPEIVAVVNAIDKQMQNGFERNLNSGRAETGVKPVIIDVADSAAEAKAIADSILDDKANGGEVCEHAVLVRSTAAGRRIEAEFISRKIPHKVSGGTRIDEAAHIRDLLSIARITSNLSHEPAWLRMTGRFRKIGAKAAQQITDRVMMSMNVEDAVTMLREESNNRKTELYLLADAIQAVASASTVADGLQAAIDAMSPIWATIWQEDWASRARDLEAVLLIAEEHPNIDSFLTTITLDASFDKQDQGSMERPEEDPVTISTIHSAKGLEWKNVHVPAFVQGGMPSLFANGPEEQDEELRIFYVAASRAEKTLAFYRPRFNGQGNFTSASVFEGIMRGLVVQTDQPRPMQSAGAAKIQTNRQIDLRSMLKR